LRHDSNHALADKAAQLEISIPGWIAQSSMALDAKEETDMA
jgi:hypothetical protein